MPATPLSIFELDITPISANLLTPLSDPLTDVLGYDLTTAGIESIVHSVASAVRTGSISYDDIDLDSITQDLFENHFDTTGNRMGKNDFDKRTGLPKKVSSECLAERKAAAEAFRRSQANPLFRGSSPGAIPRAKADKRTKRSASEIAGYTGSPILPPSPPPVPPRPPRSTPLEKRKDADGACWNILSQQESNGETNQIPLPHPSTHPEVVHEETIQGVLPAR